MISSNISNRIFSLKRNHKSGRCVLYWMSRDQRVEYNFGLISALEYAKRYGLKTVVCFCVVDSFLNASPEAFRFMAEGLLDVECGLKALNIPFKLLYGDPPAEVHNFAQNIDACAIFTDLDPLKIKQKWQKELVARFDGHVFEVDSRNIVPARVVSQKKEFAAHTIRPKIQKKLPDYLIPVGTMEPQKGEQTFYENDYTRLQALPQNPFFRGGRKNALFLLNEFLSKKLNDYGKFRNDPIKDCQSELSPYLHFGQISALEIALKVTRTWADEASKSAFLEELIVRRELAENFCLYCDDYDNENSLEPWAKENMSRTDREPRDHIYNLKDFENAQTHDELWNAAQLELKIRGKMHGYLRMYWAKKILEWTPTTRDAFKIAVYLNDRYALDGRDPNGYAGIAWSIGGVHDRPWPPRRIFGKIRYMSYSGCKAKFNVSKYIERIQAMFASNTAMPRPLPLLPP